MTSSVLAAYMQIAGSGGDEQISEAEFTKSFSKAMKIKVREATTRTCTSVPVLCAYSVPHIYIANL